MRIVTFDRGRAAPIERFESTGAASLRLGDGRGDAHVHCVHLDPGGEIGRHPAGFDQLFLVVSGTAWAAGEDGRRVALPAGQGAYIARGEQHAKGSETGAVAIMIQVSELDPGPAG
jgi:quercetin dioxygenase-like cupin family protein